MTIIIDPQSSGISGNMMIGALADLGVSTQDLKFIMEKTANEFGKVEVNFSNLNKHGIESCYCEVKIIEKGKVLNFNDFISKIKNLDIDEKIKRKSINIFTRIGEAESKVHGSSLEKVHFHEVGSADAVADVIGSVYGYYSLGLDKEDIIGLPIAVGGGNVETEHGLLPVPVPAVVELLKDSYCVGGPVNSELATPTGCAIYMEFVDEKRKFIPTITIKENGYGAGKKDFDHPNILRIIKTIESVENNKVDVIETNIDHLTGEELGYLFKRLLNNGASDVSITPIIMKKNRPGNLLKVISKKEKRDSLVNLIFEETGSLGIRINPNIHRGIAKREFIQKKIKINNEEFEVTFKIAYVNGKIISERPEYEDIKKIALKTNMPLKDIMNYCR